MPENPQVACQNLISLPSAHLHCNTRLTAQARPAHMHGVGPVPERLSGSTDRRDFPARPGSTDWRGSPSPFDQWIRLCRSVASPPAGRAGSTYIERGSVDRMARQIRALKAPSIGGSGWHLREEGHSQALGYTLARPPDVPGTGRRTPGIYGMLA